MKNKKPKSYILQDGCWNCDHKNRTSVASDIYPQCDGYQKSFIAENHGKCKRWRRI